MSSTYRGLAVRRRDKAPLLLRPTLPPRPENRRPSDHGRSGTWTLVSVKLLTVLGFALPCRRVHHFSSALFSERDVAGPMGRRSGHSSILRPLSRLVLNVGPTRGRSHPLPQPRRDRTGPYGALQHHGGGVRQRIHAVRLDCPFIWCHRRRSPSTPLLYYVPVAFLTLTLAQWQNTIWGFQMAWYSSCWRWP